MSNNSQTIRNDCQTKKSFMFQYILKRVLIFIPTLFIISLIAFGLSKVAPGDPVELINRGGLSAGDGGQLADMLATEQTYLQTAERLGLHLPVFYGALSPYSEPDTLHNVVKQAHQTLLKNLVGQYGNWQEISDYYHSLRDVEKEVYKIAPDSLNFAARRKARRAVVDLYLNHKDNKITGLLKTIQTSTQSDSSMFALQAPVQKLLDSYATVKSQASPSNNYIPSLKWYGFDNQYHNWITGFFTGDFGFSYLDNRPISSKMWDALRWTLIINFISIFLAYILSIPIGVNTAIRKDTTYDRVITTILFILYSLPVFWTGTLLIVFLTTSEYGSFFNLFPTGGITDLPPSAPFMDRMLDLGHHLVLPVVCITYGSLAFISRQMRGGMLTVIRQDYIRTAKAKGLEEKQIIWKHAFRNSLFPIITLFASVFPLAIAGSVVIEVIFSIPGMGKLLFDSIIARDWPVVYTILMFAAVLTMIGNLIADMLYAVADPRVTFNEKA